MEGQASVGEMIRFSWGKSREILFPFNFRRWLNILIIVWLAGASVQGCSANFNTPRTPTSSQQTTGKISTVSPSAGTSVQGNKNPTSSVVSANASAPAAGALPGRVKIAKKPAWNLWLVAGGILLALGFMLFFMWLSSRFNFILLDTVVTGKAAIREPFGEHRELGNSYFKWSLGFLGMVLGIFLVGGLVSAMLFGIAKGHAASIILFGILAGLLALALFLGMTVIGTVMHDLVVPIMYREKIPAIDAMNRFLDADTFAFGQVFKYLLVILGLGIAASIVQGIAAILAGIGGLIAGGIVVVPGIFLIKALPFLKLPLLVLGGLLAVVIILAVIVAVGMVMLPVAIFFRAFALTFLTRLYPDCDLLGFSGEKPQPPSQI